MADHTPNDAAERAERDASDQLALSRICAGDPQAIAVIYDRYAKTALGLAMKIVRDVEEAEDVVHDAFLAVVERAHQYQAERGSVAGWLVTTVRNLALDRVRRRQRRENIAQEELRHEPQTAPVDPETLNLLASEGTFVRAALEKLATAQRETLETAFYEGLSYPEIAARDGVPLGTVKSRASRALWALRAALGVDAEHAAAAAVDPEATSGATDAARKRRSSDR
jgi:RNA polymerase sigma-70 factor (ECF subfamily)